MQTLTRKLFPLLIVFILLVALMPRSNKFNKDYKKGAPWKHETLVSQFDFPILKTEDQIEKELLESTSEILPYYHFEEDVLVKVIREVQMLNIDASIKDGLIRELPNIYQKGVKPEGTVFASDNKSFSDRYIYIQRGKKADKVPSSEVFDASSAKRVLLLSIAHNKDIGTLDSALRHSGAYSLIVPNLVFDIQATNSAYELSDGAVSPTKGYVKAGQLIVSQGETVTSEIAQMLDSYKKEYEVNLGSARSSFALWFSDILIALGILTFLVFSIYFTNRRIFEDKGKYHYILTIVSLASAITLIIIRVDESLLLFVPFTLFAVLLQEFFRNREILVIYVVSLLPLLIFAGNGMPLFVMYLTAGVVTIQLCRYYARGWKQFLLSLVTFAVLSLLYVSFYLMDFVSGNVLAVMVQLFVASFLTVAGYTTVFLFERIFNLVSAARLAELCETSTPLLHELEQKAPGTFQHSLQVMNMSDAAARAIDADCRLIRAGALYHDIGKLRNPMCFVENESMFSSESANRYHSDLSPLQSAREIIKHVSDGVEIAQKAGLPNVVIDFIRTHHGCTKVSYFLDLFQKDGGDRELYPQFEYEGPVPSSKEQIILMLCDSIEAASRTLKEYSPQAIDSFVEGIVGAKMEQGQFLNADITIKELGIVKESIKTYLASIYHKRIAYPASNNKIR